MNTRLLPLLAAAGMMLWSGSALAQTVLNVSSWLPPSDAVTRAMMDWGKEVTERTNGRVEFRLLPKAVASPGGTFDAVRDGLADISFTVHNYIPGRFLLTQAVEMPLLGDSAEVVSVAYQRIYDRHLKNSGEDEGVKTIAVFAHGGGEIYSAGKPIRALSDLSGLKLRGTGGILGDILNALGVNVVLAPATEMYELLRNGVVDGTVGSPAGLVTFKFAPMIKYTTRVPGGLYNTSFGIFMNKAAYDRLSPEDQAVIDELSGERLARAAGGNWEQLDRQGQGLVEAAGAEVIAADEAFVRDLREKTASIEQGWIERANARGVDGAKILAELREEIRKVEAGQ